MEIIICDLAKIWEMIIGNEVFEWSETFQRERLSQCERFLFFYNLEP